MTDAVDTEKRSLFEDMSISFAELVKKEQEPITEKDYELNYRRGYRDGYEQATAEMYDLMGRYAKGKTFSRAYQTCWDFWEGRLLRWYLDGKKDDASSQQWPPHAKSSDLTDESKKSLS